MSHTTDDSDAASFHSSKSHAEDTPFILPLSEEEELVTKSNNYKASANTSFASSDYDAAITGYERALETLPSYLDYEMAVLKSNIAACFIKMEEWKKTIDSATEAIDGLEKVDPAPRPKASSEEANDNAQDTGKRDGQEAEEKVIEVGEETERKFQVLERRGHGLEDVRKIRVKALLRRAKARMELGGWAALQGADEDYKQLVSMPQLSPLDRKTVQKALKQLPPRLEEVKQQEMSEMIGKLKQLGNGILKPFGLSTDNFNMVKDENSGGYSLQFNQNR